MSLAAILIAAGTLRFVSIGAGIPYAIGVAEPEIINRVAGMMRSGNLNPHFYDYPSLYIYVQLFTACMPFACVLAATAVVSGISLLRRFSIPRALRTALIITLTVATLLPATIMSIGFDRMLAKKNAVSLAYDWIQHHVAKDAKIVIESAGLVLTETPYKGRNVQQLRLEAYSDYVDTGVEYLVASSQWYGPYLESPHVFPTEYAQYMKLFEQSQELARFSPSPDHPGPELRILKVRP
jgi:hypothetical protein